MITRLVKMTFDSARCDDFIRTFHERRAVIAAFDGCTEVELLRDAERPNIFFTRSVWRDDASLQAYRKSEFFGETWSTVKQWFVAKPEAWSVAEA